MPWYVITPIAVVLTLGGTIVWRQARPSPVPSLLWWFMDNPISRRVAGDSLLKLLALQPGMAVLDAGCGPGRLTIPLARAVGPDGEVTALDVQHSMLKRVEESAAREQLHNVRTLRAELGSGALTASVFDRAVMVSVIGEMPRAVRQDALREVLGALKPSGILAVTEMFDDPDYQRQGSVLGLLTACGFEIDGKINRGLGYTILASRQQRAETPAPLAASAQ